MYNKKSVDTVKNRGLRGCFCFTLWKLSRSCCLDEKVEMPGKNGGREIHDFYAREYRKAFSRGQDQRCELFSEKINTILRESTRAC